jgi:predicted amidophosphoribosyltransferase
LKIALKKNEREYKTIQKMIGLYCRDRHHDGESGELCSSCLELLSYAKTRLEKCPYAGDKPTCARCPVHCYKPALREKIRAVMRYAGPRMIWRHPLLAIRHLMDAGKTGSRTEC